ncbi:MAG: ParB/RepB/Spo0J family partition protein [Nitrospinales bacterium]
MNRKALGKGLNALIPEFELGFSENEGNHGGALLLVDEIAPNENQPRKFFADDQLGALAESIKEKGIIQPIVVQTTASGYQIIVGERRWRAARKAGLKKIPAIVREIGDKESLEIAIIENIHRQDLNPIEEAMAYSRLAEDFGLKQEEIAERVGKNRASIANYMRLLKLSRPLQEDIVAERLTMGHARALLALPSEKAAESVRQKILQSGLNVRQTEALVRKEVEQAETEPKKRSGKKDIFIRNIEMEAERKFGSKVQILPGKKGGKLIISYYSDEDLERILGLIASETPC